MTIVLIGMPGSGKTTLGKELALMKCLPFIDTDQLIVQRTGKTIKELLGKDFMNIETAAIKSIASNFNGIISTGGSVIYSSEAMTYLRKISTSIVYLQVSLTELTNRIKDFNERGIVIKEGMTFQELYNERCPLYEYWADYIIKNHDIEETILELNKFKSVF